MTIIPTAAYVCPAHPCIISNAPVTAAVLTERIRLHNIAIYPFQSANHAERTTPNQMAESLDNTVMAPRLDKETGVVISIVQDTMNYLFKTYRKISDQILKDTRQKNINRVYIHSDPITNVFAVIRNYAAMVETQGTPETNTQLVSIEKNHNYQRKNLRRTRLKHGMKK